VDVAASDPALLPGLRGQGGGAEGAARDLAGGPLAAGLPAIASLARGLDPQPGLTLVPPDDAEALIAAIRPLSKAPRESAKRFSARGPALNA
jgi:hypothetical protein